jgi:hypothetical protein
MAKRLSGLAAALALVLAACAGTGVSSTTSQSLETSTTAPTPAPSTTVPAPGTTTPAAPSTTTQRIDVEFAAGEVIGPAEIQVQLGETVDVWVFSDVPDEVHVHGYDLTFELAAGVPSQISFVADVPGVFEVELHDAGTPLFDLEVIG